MHQLRGLYPDLWFSVSATTRARRPGEVDGLDYHFVSDAEFDRMIAEDELLEWADIHGGTHRSGTPRGPIERRMADGLPALVELDLNGARTVRKVLPEALLVFIRPPSWDVLVDRLTGRGTEPPDVIARRLATAQEELAAHAEFDVELVNDDVRRAARDLLTLMVAPSSSAALRTDAQDG